MPDLYLTRTDHLATVTVDRLPRERHILFLDVVPGAGRR